MAVPRSPNYPSLPLDAALAAVAPALKAENRNKMGRITLAKHLGYTSLNGRALSKIGALRAYGLIDGGGDELRVSDDAMIGLKAPPGSSERKTALERCATRPALFKAIRADFPDTLPSVDNLGFWLAKNGYTDKASGKAAETYLSTMRLVSGGDAAYKPPVSNEEDLPQPEKVEVGDLVTVERDGVLIYQSARVLEIKEHDGTTWVWTDGGDAWTEMDTVTLETKSQAPGRSPPPPPLAPPLGGRPGLQAINGIVMRTAVFPLPEADATLTFPAALSAESLNLLGHFLHLTIQQAQWAKKAAPVLYADDAAPDAEKTG